MNTHVKIKNLVKSLLESSNLDGHTNAKSSRQDLKRGFFYFCAHLFLLAPSQSACVTLYGDRDSHNDSPRQSRHEIPRWPWPLLPLLPWLPCRPWPATISTPPMTITATPLAAMTTTVLLPHWRPRPLGNHDSPALLATATPPNGRCPSSPIHSVCDEKVHDKRVQGVILCWSEFESYWWSAAHKIESSKLGEPSNKI